MDYPHSPISTTHLDIKHLHFWRLSSLTVDIQILQPPEGIFSLLDLSVLKLEYICLLFQVARLGSKHLSVVNHLASTYIIAHAGMGSLVIEF